MILKFGFNGPNFKKTPLGKKPILPGVFQQNLNIFGQLAETTQMARCSPNTDLERSQILVSKLMKKMKLGNKPWVGF